MKNLKAKLLNVLLVSALGAAATFGSIAGGIVQASAADAGAPSKVFTATSSATVGADETDSTKTAFVIPNGGKVSFRRDLALKWFTGANEAEYLNMAFSLKNLVFETLTFTFEAGVASANKDSKAVNKVVFTKGDTTDVTVKVNDGAEEIVDVSSTITLALDENGDEEVGQYDLLINGDEVGTFTNIGVAFADYSASGITPMVITATMPANSTEKQIVIFNELNGQDFTLNANGAIAEDTAAPVLVVNDEISGFALGSTFSLDYEEVDVIDTTLTKTIEFYQYNPTHTEPSYKALSTTTTFSDTTYSESETVKTTVYAKEGKEFVSVKVKIEDDTFKGDTAVTYDLSWYANQIVKPTVTNTTENEAVANLSYIPVAINKTAPKFSSTYNFETYESGVLKEAAEEANAGSSAYVYLPSVLGMFEDDDTGYKSLRFNIYYKSQTSSSSSSLTDKEYDELKIPVNNPGWYEFKIVAIDKSGNVTTVKENDGVKDVVVTADNVWDLENVPSFRFKVVSSELEIEDERAADRQKSGTIGVSFTVEEFDVNGPSDYASEYALYYFDMDLFKAKYPAANVDKNILASIDYEALTLTVNAGDDYAERYAAQYAFRLSELLDGVDADELLKVNEDGSAILRRIGEKDASVDEDVYPDNKYKWDAEAKSFLPAEGGTYIVFGVFANNEQLGKTVGGYRVVTVNATEDEIPGETEWLKNNIASIILFSIAGVMLVIIVILSLVKPSEETLEDIDEKKRAKKANKK